MKSKFQSSMVVLVIVMLVNALSYGTIIPLLYPYSARFGIDPVGLSFLFASFSLFQFLATPIIGRLSDKYGRKPLLVLSLFGTSLSLALFASAQGAIMLFVARILDGITGGNISVAQAVIADTHKPQDRVRLFGWLGAAFGVGFLIGPALGGLLSQFGLSVPFWFASLLACAGGLAALLFLPETHLDRSKHQHTQFQAFDFPRLVRSLMAPTTGILLLITLLASIGGNAFILGFQSVTIDVLLFTPTQVGLLFAAFGLVSIIMQGFGIQYLLKLASSRTLLMVSLGAGAVLLAALGFATSAFWFLLVLLPYMWVPPAYPFLSGLISSATSDEDQGGMLGMSQAYTSIGQVIGPLLAGVIAQWYISGSFWIAAGFLLMGLVLAVRLPKVSSLSKI